MRALNETDLKFLEESSQDESYDNVLAARELADDVAGMSPERKITVHYEDGTAKEIDVKRIGNIAFGAKEIDPPGNGDNWRNTGDK